MKKIGYKKFLITVKGCNAIYSLTIRESKLTFHKFENFDNYKVLDYEKFTLIIYSIGVLCIDKNQLFNDLYFKFTDLLNKSIDTVFKLPSTVLSNNYSNSIAKYGVNEIVKVKNFNQTFEVKFSFFSYSTNNQKELFYFLESDTTFLISKEEFINATI